MRDYAFHPAVTQPVLPHLDNRHDQPQPSQANEVAPQQAQPQSTQAKTRADTPAGTQLTGTVMFDDERGGVQHHAPKQKDLKQRLKTTVQQRSRSAKRKSMTRINLNPDDDDEPIREEAANTVSRLRKDGREAVEKDLSEEFDPLQRYALLHNAMCEVDEQDLPQTEKEDLKEQLQGMLNDLMNTHRTEIRKGLKDAHEIEAAMQMMAGGSAANPASLRELRFLYGAKGQGVFDSPLSPLAMAKALQQRFGATNFSSALGSLRSKMAHELRVEDHKSLNPRFWLCMSDASAFNAVQSAYAIAAELRRDLVEKAHVLPRASEAAISVGILTMVESGKSKINVLVSQVYDGKDGDPATRGRVYQQVMQAVKRLPHTMWPLDKLNVRLDLIDELSKQCVSAYGNMPMPELAVERMERQWRADLDAQKARREAPAKQPPVDLKEALNLVDELNKKWISAHGNKPMPKPPAERRERQRRPDLEAWKTPLVPPVA